MSRNGAGSYTLPAPYPSGFSNGTTIDAPTMNTVFQDVQTALTASTAADGQTPISGNWAFSGYNLLNVGTFSATAATFTDASTSNGLTVGNQLVVTKGGATITAGGLTVTAGGAKVTAGGLTVTADGAAITGNTTITGTLGGLTGLTVASGGATVKGNSTITGTLGGLTGLTVASGGATITGNSTVTGTMTVSNGTSGTQAVNYSQFPASLVASGSASLPSGLQLRWSNGTVGGAGTTAITFPSAFSNACLQVVVSPVYAGSGTPGSVTAAAGSLTASGFNLGSSTGLSFSYLAVGY